MRVWNLFEINFLGQKSQTTPLSPMKLLSETTRVYRHIWTQKAHFPQGGMKAPFLSNWIFLPLPSNRVKSIRYSLQLCSNIFDQKDLLGAEMVLIVCFWDAICIRAYKTLSVPHWKHSSQFKLFQIMTIISDKNECSFIIKLKQSQLLVRKSFKVFSQLSSFLTFLDNLRV